MLHFIKSIEDKWIDYIKDDPVRPELSAEFRVEENRFIATIIEDDKPAGMVCISLHDFIPADVSDLIKTSSNPTTAVFYTIWSYKPGGGVNLLRKTLEEICKIYPGIDTFVTLSPKTELAHRFHTKNGAVVLRENAATINYRYNYAV